MKKSLKKALFLTPLMLLIPGTGLVFPQVKVSSQGGTSNQTYNITNTSDGVTTNTVSGMMRVHNRQFIDVLNETGFASAVTVAAVNGYNIRVSNSQPISSNITVPDTVFVEFVGAGKLSVNSGITATLGGGYNVDFGKRVFFGAGTVKVKNVPYVRPEHFGARDDSTFDSAAAFNRAMDCFPNYTRGVIELSSGARYLINSTVVFPTAHTLRQVILNGNGAFIYTTSSDTLFTIRNITPAGNSFLRGQNIIEGLYMKQIGTLGNGVAIALVNATEQKVRDCHIQGFNTGVLMLNENSGWSEHNYISSMRFIYCDTMIVQNAKGSGTSSFRNNYFNHIAGSTSSTKVVQDGGQAIGVAVIGTGAAGTPNIYQSTYINFSLGLNDSSDGFYINGRCNNIFAQASFESFGGDGVRSRAFHFGPQATNLQFWIYADFATMGDLDKAIYNESAYAPQNIYTQIIGQTANSALGSSAIWDGTHQQWITSVIHNDSIGGLLAAPPGDVQSVFNHIVTSTGVNRFRTRAAQPLEFTRVRTTATLGPIRAHNIGRLAAPEDTTQIDVSNADFIQFADGNDGLDTVSNFVDTQGFIDGIAGRKLYVLFNDSTVIESLDAATGRIFFPADSRNRRTHSGLRTLFYSYNDGILGGITWRELFSHWPMESVAWNPAAIDSGGVDSTSVVYAGAEVGDPVQLGFTSITTAGGDWVLSGHVVSADNIKVYLRRFKAGTRNLPSGTLRYKIVR